MKKDNKTTKESLLEIDDLRIRLDEAEETLSSIRRGEVDGLVVSGPKGDQVYTLKGAERSYRFFVEAMNEGAVTLAFDGTILYCNDRFAEMIGTPYQKIVGESMYRFISQSDSFEPAFQKGKTERIKTEILLKRKDHLPMPAFISLNPMEEDTVPGICAIITDLTEHKRQSELLNERIEQLARMSSQLTLAEQRERRRLAEIIHGDLQQSLVGAKIDLEVLLERMGNEHRDSLKRIYELLVESLKTSRSLSTQMASHILYERGMAPGFKWLARTMGETHKINIETDIISEVLIESEELKVLLFESVRELLFNVIKHARSSWARIKMVHEEAGILRITVSDEGVGFDSDEIVKNLGRGDRFGLFSIRERLELIGGSLEINSSPGHGAEFNLIVPLDKATTKEPLDPGEISFEETRAASLGAGRQIRVLLVDDHVVMRQGLLSLLDGHSDIKVVGEAGDGEEAVRMARELQPEVILMDINMPEMDGMKATRLIHSELPHIRIIGLSMYDGAETEEGMLNAGAAAFVSKSGRTDSLLAVIRGRSPKTAGQRLEVAL